MNGLWSTDLLLIKVWGLTKNSVVSSYMGQKSLHEGKFFLQNTINSTEMYMKYLKCLKLLLEIGWKNFFYMNLITFFDMGENYWHGRVTGNNTIF